MVNNKNSISEYAEIKESKIHNKGVFAKKDIPKRTKIIEYVGEKITKSESQKRAEKQLKKSKNHTVDGGVYIFELNKKYDIDGKVSWNPAQYINHSCSPNCEVEIIKGKIWIISLRKIKKGEEISYNYGYDLDEYKEHPCICGSRNCVGYILAEEHWKKIKKN
jgi:hypothetical protein